MKNYPPATDELILQFDVARMFLAEEEEEEVSIVVSLKDITERKRAETIQKIQYTIADKVVTARDLTEFYETIRNELSQLIDTRNFYIAFYDEKTDLLSAIFEKDEKDQIPQWPAAKSLTGQVIKKQKSLLLKKDEILRLVNIDEIELIGTMAEAWVGVPLKIGGKVSGAMVVQSYDNPQAYNQTDLELLEMIASQMSICIERKRAEEALRKSEEQYRLIVENASDGIEISQQDRIIFSNSRFAEMLGYTVEELKNIPFSRIFTEQATRELYERQAKRIAGIPVPNHYETTFQKKDGTVIDVGVTYEIIDYQGEPATFGIIRDITERKRAEEALKSNFAILRLAGESAKFGGWSVNLTENRVIWSDEVAAIHEMPAGYSPSVDESIRFYAPEWRDKIAKVFNDCAQKGIPYDEVMEIITANGKRVWVRTIGEAFIDDSGKIVKVQGSLQDITKQKQAEEQIRYQANLLQNVPDAIIASDENGFIKVWNPAAEKIYGWKAEEVIGKKFHEIIKPEYRYQSREEVFEKIKADGVWSGEIVHRRKDGEPLSVLSTISILKDAAGNQVGLVSVNHDITEQKRMEEALSAAEAQLRQTQKMEALGQLASGIAHDFNNLLGIIMGHASLLKMGKQSPEKVQHSVETIERTARRGADLVKQLLTLARKSEPVTAPVYLSEMIAETVKLLNEIFPRTVVIQTEIQSSLPYILADVSQIHQVLMNLCLNARDAMPQGGTLRIGAKRMAGEELRQRHADATVSEYVELSVSDSGIGMDEATIERIFDPFFTTKAPGKGTGLGLTTVHSIVRNHNGFIEVQSEPGVGTTFAVYLPAPEMPEGEISSPAGAGEPEAMAGGSETILLIEDEENIIELVSAVFEAHGYQVLTAGDGVKGVELYAQQKDKIALVVSDMGLPGLTGDEVFRRIRAINPQAKVILASGFIDPEQKSEFFKAGLAQFLQKPYLPEEALKVIREVLDRE